jgi:hypothetical protein
MLVACFAIKLFGGNWFEVVCTNEHFSQVCEFIDKHILLENILAFFLYIPFTAILILCACRLSTPNKNQLAILCISLMFVWFSMFLSITVKTILEFIAFLIFPIAFNKWNIKKTWFYGLIGYAMDLSFQLLSLFTRGVKVAIIGDSNTLVALILMIDYYIMIILHFLLIKQRKEKQNG